MNISEYIKKYKKIIEENKKYDKKIKIAYLPSSTVRCVKEILTVMCDSIDVNAEVYCSDYNQYNQQIIDSGSQLYSFKPDLVILAVDIETMLADNYFTMFTEEKEKKDQVKNKILKNIISLINSISNSLSCSIIVHNFEVPYYSPLGILENKQELGFQEMIEDVNHELRNDFKNIDKVYIFNYNEFLSKIGKKNKMDYKMYYIGDIKLDMKYIPDLCSEYMGYIRPITSTIKKCLVLDLDNTLWGGIAGEDGITGIRLAPVGEGKSFYEFQKYIKMLFQRGVILAINSKNNYEDALDIINNHPYMVLREENFADMEINWNDKASNIKTISKKLNIGMDSIVFIDDDELNCEIVKNSLPEVEVVNLPRDPSKYVNIFMDIASKFNVLYLTEEDKHKGSMYAQNRKREEFKSEFSDIDEYLEDLNITVNIKEDDILSISRIAQLTQKTNQFNLTTYRYSKTDIKRFLNDACFSVLSISVKDKFGDNGLCGTVIIEKEQEIWNIDTFLLSCRVMGRKIEYAIMNYIEVSALKSGIKNIRGKYISTKKNIPVKHFYSDMNFNLISTKEGVDFYEKSICIEVEKPKFIKIVI
ncbi:HAD-IIIC family phosphatase [Clostridium tyrobutyricum]|uniref:HAD-IIIC family phosphatase n=1 Tax=Clostridium tyrobutyricum TaxID=1519 RepID=UPI0002EDB580|nr:HAD family hydrolase [Clostridium tyrobutyricum]